MTTAAAAKRFWKDTTINANDDGYAIMLDGRAVKTPNGSAFSAPTSALADAICAEWDAQVEKINPDEMPMFKFAVTAIDRVTPQRAAIVDELASYGANDLLCYREAAEHQLAAHQETVWHPYLLWVDQELGVTLKCFEGIMPGQQDEDAKNVMRHLVDAYDDFALSGLHSLVTVTGSLILGLAAAADHQPMDQIIAAAQLDELWQQEKWGYDDEADARLKSHQLVLQQAYSYLALLKS